MERAENGFETRRLAADSVQRIQISGARKNHHVCRSGINRRSEAMAIMQKSRLLNLATPLGEDTLVLTRSRGTEEMSRLFGLELE
ncbi:MAG TPA: hypothetical protein EYP14_20570 [Planctomycetaceae bacterium]|nr:hypothetical protein [Planctomycetaceae bacterium]